MFHFAIQQQIILNAIQTTDCPLTDVACICSNETFVDELVEQIPLVCSEDDITRNYILMLEEFKMVVILYSITCTLVVQQRNRILSLLGPRPNMHKQ